MKSVVKCFGVCLFGLAGVTMLRAGTRDLARVPESIRELMQDQKYDEAAAAIDRLLAASDEKPKAPDYLVYLKGRALHLAGKHREALATFARLERDFATSPWTRRAKFGQAAALLKLGDFEAAEQIYEEEVRFLLSTERKHEIASIYLEFADAYFQPPKVAIQEKKPDYQKALSFYKQALAVGPKPIRRVEVEFRVARCHQELGQHAEAVAEYRTFLKAHPKSQFDIEARYRLGAVQLAQGQNVEARKTWKDLLDAHADHKTELPHELVEAYSNTDTQRLAEAAHGISRTYGLPKPPSIEDLELGVSAAERFMANFPDIKLAAQSALEIAQAYVSHNRQDEAIVRLKKLLADPKYVGADVIPDARVLLGFAYQRQKKFPEAIAAWQEYLAKHPAHPSWAQVQQAIIDTEFLTALEARREASAPRTDAETKSKKFADARRLWEAFLARYPLDGRAAAIMLEFGLMNHDQEKFGDAIADWTQLVSKYPGTEESSRGQYLIGLTYEEKLTKFDDALAAYRKLNWGQFAARAAERIDRLGRQELAVATERVFRTNQQPRIKVTTRNIKQLNVKAYRVDLETYFRKMHLATGLEQLDIALIDPEKSWIFDIPNYVDHKQLTSHVEIPLDSPGVMAVTVANEGSIDPGLGMREAIQVRPMEATTMVMVSDLDMLVKCSRNELFVFVENMRTGKPFPGIKLLMSDGGKVFADGTTNDDGVYVGAVSDENQIWDALKSSSDIRVFAVAEGAGAATPGPHFASNVVGLQGVEFAQGISSKGYIYTDRPTYRPGQLVHVRGVVRWVKGDEYFFEADKKFKLDVYDARGRQLRSEDVTLGEFGSFATHFVLPAESPQGDYRVHVHDPAEPDKHNYQGTFAVREYQLQPVLIEIDTPQKVYYRGEQVTGTIKLRYYYGSPVAEREIRYVLPDGTIQTARTSAAGEVPFKFDTREFREDQVLQIVVQYPELNLASGLNLFLATRGFRASVATARDVFISGETFDVTVTTTDAAGKKLGQKMTLAVVQRQLRAAGFSPAGSRTPEGQTADRQTGDVQTAGPRPAARDEIGERTVQEHKLTTDTETGIGRTTIRIAEAGTYILRTTGTDRFGNPVSAERLVTVSGDDDTVRLRILSDRHLYKAGDTARVQVHWREEPALALVTYQGARVLGYRLIELNKGTNQLEIPINEKLAPNFDLTVSVMTDSGGEYRAKISSAIPRPEGGSSSAIPRPLQGLIAPYVLVTQGVALGWHIPALRAEEPQGAPLPLPTFHEASSPFEVERPLVVTLKPARDRVLPGDEVEVLVTVTDPQGKPVRAELSLAMIEKSLLEVFPDQLAAITQFFEGARRTSALRTVASCTFRYAPATRDISKTLIVEAERIATAEMERASRAAAAAAAERISEFSPNLSLVVDAEASAFDEPGEDQVSMMIPFRTGAVAGSGTGGFAFSRGEVDAATQKARELKAGIDAHGFQRDYRELKDQAILESLQSIDRSAIPFGKDATAAIKFPDARRWEDLTEHRKRQLERSDYRYFAQSEQGGLKEYAADFLNRSAGREWGKSAQLGLLFSNGQMNLADAHFVLDGKLDPSIAKAGVTVIPELLLRETAYWNPRVVTDDNGQATLSITVPDRSTAWQLAARGITIGTLTGQATAELVAKKDLFGELKLPLAFVDGDSAQILATVHNDVVQNGKIEVTLKTTIAGRSRDETRTIDVERKGTHELMFDREIAGTGEAVFELGVKAIGAPAPLEDSSRAVVPIRPYGIPVYSTTGGTASANMTAWISPPAGNPMRDASLQIVIGPSVERSLLDVVLGPSTGFGSGYVDCHRLLVAESPLERTTSDLMAAIGLLKLLGETRDKGSPEASALADRVRSSIGHLVSTQNDDGGWHWSAARGAKQGSSDRNSSARALWALSLARKAGYAVPEDAFNKAITFVQTAFTAARENDYDGKAVLLHALAAGGRGDFAYANRLHRSRPSLSPTALVYLSLAFIEMDRKEIARELVDLLAPKLAIATSNRQPGTAEKRPPFVSAEVRALYLIALNAVAPSESELKETAEWLLAHRAGPRWQPERATGPATLGLAEYFATARFAAEHYKLKIFVNDHEVKELDFDGAAGTQILDVPKEVLARGEKLPEKEFPGDQRKQRINFELTGRGRFTFHCVMSGFVAADQLKSTTQDWHLSRFYEPAPIELDGREIPRGFDVLAGSYTAWRNPVTELPVGQRAEVRIFLWPRNVDQRPEDQLEYLVVTEPIPAGCTVLEKSITGNFDRYEIHPGAITFYVGNRAHPGEIRFDLYGYTAGTYRAAPTIVRNFYDPERMMVTKPHPLTVLVAGQKSKDDYKLTPRELYELGKRLLAKAKEGSRELEIGSGDVGIGIRKANENEGIRQSPALFEAAGRHLSELFDKYQLKPEVYKEVAQMLFEVSLNFGRAPEIVRYFEIIKEKWPELEIAFEQIVKIGAAYRELNEYERSYLVFRATAESSFARESEIGGFLESQGEFERSLAVMDRILREYPAEPYIASATYALAQRVYAMAPNAATDAKLREHKITRVDLIRDAIGRLDDFLTVWPGDPAADQASFSLASALVELESWPAAIARANRFAERYPKSEYLDSFWYIIGYSHFAGGEHRAALDMCRRVADAKRTDPVTGREIESRNKWRAIYISGQIHHALDEPAEAITEYGRVADRFPDAKETIAYFTRKAIELPEVTTTKPAAKQTPAAADQKGNNEGRSVEVELKYRNVASCELKVYRIDLLKFGLIERDLSNITKINLAGIRPLHEATVELGDGKDYADRTKRLDLPLTNEGAYLVVCRGEDLHTSGLVLVSPLVVEVQEEPASGRVRATVKNTVSDKYASDIHVKVIGSRNDQFKDGRTDLRGVFVADGIAGRSTVIARAGDAQYAFHRGQIELGPPPAPAAKPPAAAPAQAGPPAQPDAPQELLRGLFEGNSLIQEQKGKELKDLYEKKSKGVQAQQAF